MIDYQDNYSDSYREQLGESIRRARDFGFDRIPFVSEASNVSDDALAIAGDLTSDFSEFLHRLLPGYWGSSCQTLSTQLFAALNSNGIAADIVIGNVIINGTDEFETTLDVLMAEVCATDEIEGHQAIHAWVSLGDDTIIDAALPSRLVKHYRAPPEIGNVIFVERASFLSEHYRLRYQPLLVGTEFFAKTNPPDPLELLLKLRALRGK
ncbi:hypothetical protein [Burkholderia gladioli]|uniref:hypothetical protein n=1 Tax=Burkholderia gladioli TaxID=28095 RepID=UPI00163F323E|nr:hypothetical protein [Burkholderia gladioli]